jgi:uncharacterized repeat protein (TIGR01451 family)
MRLLKSLNKILSVIATLALLLNSLSTPLVALAQEMSPSPEPTPVETTTPSEEPTIVPTEEATVSPETTPLETATAEPEVTVEATPVVEETLPSQDTQADVQGKAINENAQPEAPPTESGGVEEETSDPVPTVTPVQPEEEGTLTAEVVETSLFSETLTENNWFQVITDKLDYSPTEAVVITGYGFTPGETYTLTVSSSDEPATSTTVEVTADSNGGFVYVYQLDGIYRPNYLVEVKSGETMVALTTFTDSVANTIDQCQNGGVGDPLEPCNESDFPASTGYGYEGNANANSNNSHWNEGDFVPLRIIGTDYSAGAGYIQFSIDVTKGGKHAYDYIGDFDGTETTGTSSAINANHNNPVTDIIPGASATAPDSVGTVPAATLAGFPVACGSNTFVGSQLSGQVKAWGTGGPLTVTYVSQNVGSSDCTTTVQVAWSATQPSFSGTIVIAYGAHIARQTDWGNGNSAISINGSPYHSSLVQYSTGGETKVIGQQDAKLAANAVIVPGSINIIKNTIAGNGTFNYTTTGLGLSNFGITTSGNTGNHLFNNLIPGTDGGTRTITETVPSGWSLTGLSCTSTLQSNQGAPLSTYGTDLAGGVVTVSDLAQGDTVTCTYTNTIQNGHIIVDKVTSPSGSSQSFNFDASGGSYADFSLTDVATPNDQELLPGNYSVSETVPTGWDLTNTSCVSSIQDIETAGSLELDPNETITCTFTNTQRGNIVVDKVTNPAGDPQSFSFDASGGVYGDFSLTDLAAPNNQELVPGSYSVSETEPAGWDLTNTTCISSIQDSESAGSLELDAGETITCTFTNTKLGEISGFKYQDLDGDTNTTEYLANPVQGLLVQLWQWITNSYQNTGQTDTTDASGFYSFTGLLPGLYQVREVLSSLGSSWTNLTSTSVGVTLDAGEIDGQNNFINTQYGSIVIVKQTDPDGDSQVFDFDLSYGDLDADLSDGQSDDSGDLLPGTYSVSENTPPGWDLTSATCDDGSAPSSISLSSGETVICTFTNQKDSGIVVFKQTIPDGSPENFVFVSDYHIDNFTLTDGFFDLSGDLTPGTYSVTEVAEPGWDLTSATCNDGSDPSAIDLSAGETVVCTFTNTQRGHIIVDKVTDPSGSEQSFNFDATGGVYGDFSLTDEAAPNDQALVPGTYGVSETEPFGWDLTNTTCVSSIRDNETASSLELDAGETITCTFTNTELGNVTVVKFNDHDGNGVKDDGDETLGDTGDGDDPEIVATRWEIHLDGEGVDSDQWTGAQVAGQVTFSDLLPNSFTLSEQIKPGWAQTSISCNQEGEDYDAVNDNLSFTLVAGEDVTCYIGNQGRGSITVNKNLDTDSSGGADVFGYTDMFWELDSADHAMGSTVQVPAGSYGISEIQLTNYHFTSLVCKDVNIGSQTTSVDVAPGEDVVCTYTNTRDTGNIQLTKLIDADGDLGTTDDRTPFEGWVMDVDPDGADTSDPSLDPTDVNGETSALGIKTGTYWVTEDPNGPTDNYHFLESFCTLNEEPTGNSGTGSFGGVEVATDTTTYCTFINARDTGTITIDKVTDPSESTEQFTINLNQGLFDTPTLIHSSVLADQDTPDTYSVPTGEYWLQELDDTGWDLVGAECVVNEDQENSFDPRGDGFVINTDDNVYCTFTNQQQILGVSIEKSNDKSGGASAGDTVTYTLVVTNSGNQTIHNLDITDALPGGFSYISGTTTGDTSADPSVAGSNLTWEDVTDLAGGTSFTIHYQVKIADDVVNGTYVNFATCDGDVRSEQETIDCNVDDSSVPIGQGRSYGGNLTPQVLGISTELPATGSPTALLIVALGALGTGLFLRNYSGKKGKKHAKK